MRYGTPVLIALTAAGVLLVVGSREATGTFTAAHHGPAAPTAAKGPAAKGPAPKAELVAALQRSQRVPHQFSVNSDLPDKQRVRADGAYDAKAKKIKYHRTETGGSNPTAVQLMVIGTDEYTRQSAADTWVHLDLKRVKKGGSSDFDMTDPLGLTHFVSTIRSVTRVDAHTFRGTYDPFAGKGEFLPLGLPSILTLGWGGNDPFTVRTDAHGWVTSLDLVLTVKDQTLRMHTQLTGHGKPQTITKPRHAGEAMDFYYDK